MAPRARVRRLLGGSLAAVIALFAFPALATPAQATSSGAAQFIVEAPGLDLATLLGSVGSAPATSLPLISGSTAWLTPAQFSAISTIQGVLLLPDLPVEVSADPGAFTSKVRKPAALFPQETGASSLAAAGDDGSGVTVAVLDTGIDALPDFAGRLLGGVDLSGGGNPFQDNYGHGTFVAGLIAGDGASSNGEYSGEAPGANLVSIKVAGASGQTDMGTVIEGIGWAVAHQAQYAIRVLNLSLGAPPVLPAVVDPLDQAVEAAWHDGIVVTTTAGNSGPDAGTITAPGDDPLVLTVGAFDDNGTVTSSDDTIPAFSSEGPTISDGYFKPDLVASGRSVVSLMAPGSTIATDYPSAQIGTSNFVGSGTSFSSAITAGAVALLLHDDPLLTPDQVKARLLWAATPGPVGNPFVDGHGELNVADAVSAPNVDLVQYPAGVGALGGPEEMASTWAESSWDPANWVVPLGTAATPWNSPSQPGAASGGAGSGDLQGDSWNNGSWNSTEWNGAAWNSTEWNSTEWNSTEWNSTEWNSTEWNSTEWNSTEWNSTEWNSTEWNSTEWNSTEWNSTEWNSSSWS